MPPHNPARRALTWWFRWPANPWVSVNFSVDFSPAKAWLAGVPGVTVTHLLAAAIAQTLRAHPKANGRVIGERIVLEEHVGIAMPVSLLGHDDASEVSMAIVADVDTLSLRELADKARARVESERSGKRADPFVQFLFGLASRAPGPIFRGSLRTMDRALRTQTIGRAVYHQIGVTTGLSNAGAAFSPKNGMLFRGAAVAPPQRLFQVGTFWGASAVQEEVVAVGGKPQVRPMLPMLLLFDHRLIDGVMAGRVATTFGEIMAEPGKWFGEDGAGRG